ncbi:MAG: hypothetical protein RLN70_02115 [Rhodospirillaceae bacterium]
MNDHVLRDADEARELLRHPKLAEAFTALEQGYVEAFVACKAGDDVPRFRLAEAVKVLRGVRRHLEEYVEAGDVSARAAQELGRGKRGIF